MGQHSSLQGGQITQAVDGEESSGGGRMNSQWREREYSRHTAGRGGNHTLIILYQHNGEEIPQYKNRKDAVPIHES